MHPAQSDTTRAIHRRATRIEIIVGLVAATILGLMAVVTRTDWTYLVHHSPVQVATPTLGMVAIGSLIVAAICVGCVASNRRVTR